MDDVDSDDEGEILNLLVFLVVVLNHVNTWVFLSFGGILNY